MQLLRQLPTLADADYCVCSVLARPTRVPMRISSCLSPSSRE